MFELSTAGISTFTNPRIEDAYHDEKTLIGRSGKRLGVLAPEGPEGRFRCFFGAGMVVVMTAYHKMREHQLLHKRLEFEHYLWALLFMVVYSKSKAALCAHLGGRDSKTVRTKTWSFIFALDELNYYVVSYLSIIASKEQVALTSTKILFSNMFRSDTSNDAILFVDGADL